MDFIIQDHLNTSSIKEGLDYLIFIIKSLLAIWIYIYTQLQKINQ